MSKIASKDSPVKIEPKTGVEQENVHLMKDIKDSHHSNIALFVSNLNVTSNKRKSILKNINMEARFGEITALMGPSGSGKTSLLRFLADLRSSNLTYDGKKILVGNFKYVSQEDHLHGFMSVDKYMNNIFGLNYGFVDSINFEERDKIKDLILSEMQLLKAKQTKVGDIFIHGLSGGEKRRLSMALELISKPRLLILDEPTSGLDSFAAEKVMESLKDLVVKENIAVVLTIHQPSSRIFKMIDRLILLKEGEIFYHDASSKLNNFYELNDERMWENYNPADQCLEILAAKENPKKEQYSLTCSYEEMSAHQVSMKENKDKPKNLFKPANIFEKFIFLSYRNLKNIFLNPLVLGVRIAMYIMLCFMVGAIFWDLGSSFNHGSIISRSSVLFYVDAFLVFMSIAALPAFMMERAIIEKEINNKLYHPILYQLSNWITSFIGIVIITIISTLFVVLMCNLNNFGIFFVNLFLSLLIAEGLASLCSILVPHYIIGMALIAGLYGMFMLCEGFLIVKDDIPPWFIWGYYMAFHTYTFRIFMYNEFESIKSFSNSNFKGGKDVLEFYGMGDVNVGHELLILMGYVLGIQLLIGLVMILKYRYKKK